MRAWAPDHFASARALVELDARHTSAASLRRAVSTAYYALFQSLCDVCARRLVGESAPLPVFTRVLRSIDHGVAKNALNPQHVGEGSQLLQLANAFSELHTAREWADYNPAPRPKYDAERNFTPFTHAEALALIDSAEIGVQALDALGDETLLDLAVRLVVKPRPKSQT